MKFKRRLKLEKGSLDIAPLIDVVFLLLIFFMLTSNFVTQAAIDVSLPKAVSSEKSYNVDLSIVINDKDEIILKGKKINFKELKNIIKENYSDKNKIVIIKSDKSASMGIVVNVWDICREAGLKKVNIATMMDNN